MQACPHRAALAFLMSAAFLPGAAAAQDLIAATPAPLALAAAPAPAAAAGPQEEPLADGAVALAFSPVGMDSSFDPGAWRASLGLAPGRDAGRVADVQAFVLAGASVPVEARPEAEAVSASREAAPDPADSHGNPAVSRLAAFAELDRIEGEDAGTPDPAPEAPAVGAYAVAYSPPEHAAATAAGGPDDGAAAVGIVEAKGAGTVAEEGIEGAGLSGASLDAGHNGKAAARVPTPRPAPARRLVEDVPAAPDLVRPSRRAARKAVPAPAPEPVGLL